jgi:hypothetical protein
MGSEGSEQSRDGSRDSAGRNNNGGQNSSAGQSGGAGQSGASQSGAGRYGNAGRGNDGGQGGSTGRGSSGPPSDPLADFQRWLMKAGARSLGRDVADRVRSTVTGRKRSSGDVWDTATTEPPQDEAPECAWCPICRAARRYREGSAGQGGTSPGSGLGSQIAGVSDTLTGLAQDAFGIFEQALRGVQPRPPARPGNWAASSPAPGSAPPAGDAPGTASPASASPGGAAPGGAPHSAAPDSAAPGTAATGTGWPDPSAAGAASSGAASSGAAPSSAVPAGPSAPEGAGSDDGPVVGSPVTGRAAVHPQDEHGEPADEGGNRDEGGQAGDSPPERGGDDQVERPAE